MSTVGWLLVVVVGIALGFSVGKLWPGSAAKLTALQRERDAAREDLRDYRQEVSSHFERTAELFDKVTADYRGLYEHLATSARQLGAIRGESVDSRLAKPEQRRLAEVAPPPVHPVEPTEPLEPNEPMEPMEPIAPMEPGERMDLAEEPEEPEEPEESKLPQDAAQPEDTPPTEESPGTPDKPPEPR